MGSPPDYKPYLTEQQWKELISKLNEDEKQLLRLFEEYQMISEDEAIKGLNTSWRKAYLNILGGITKKIGKIINVSAGENDWFIAIRRPDDRILRWAISGSDCKILRRLRKKGYL
jgi:sugar-specific transcriptional regulator TrmB